MYPHLPDLPDPELHPEFYADVPIKRLMAWLVDTLITGFLTLIVVVLTGFLTIFVAPLLFLAINFAYRAVSIARHGGTPGMRLMAISLFTHRGEPPDTALAMFHTAGYLACASFVVPQIVSIVMMLTTERQQSLPDMVLGTVMLNHATRF